ncbi:hypothetical protein MMC08_008483 [Hypocenomyce scalaris]|nr:hypothetical protein [Hypocenomyce scalaris]
MASLKYDAKTAEDCVVRSINAIHTHITSQAYRPADRWSSTLYLTGALLPLVCVIVKSDNAQQIRVAAIDAFNKDLSMLNQLSPTFSLARHTLHRLQRIINTVKRAIHTAANSITLDNPNEFDPESLVPQNTDFFNHNYSKDLVNQPLLNGPWTYSLMHGPDVDVSSTIADGMDLLWSDNDFLNNRRIVFPSGYT